jgi:hypothetical protein
MQKLTKKEYEEEIKFLKDAGLTEEEIESYFDLFNFDITDCKSKILNFGVNTCWIRGKLIR